MEKIKIIIKNNKYIYIYMMGHSTVQQKLTEHYKSTIL